MSDPVRRGLDGLRRDAARAQRRPERGLMIAIGLADPDEDGAEGGASSKGAAVNKDLTAGGYEDLQDQDRAVEEESHEGPMIPEEDEYFDLVERAEPPDPDKDEKLRRRR